MAAGALPDEIRKGPFTASRAAALGITRQMLRGSRFRRVMRDVYVDVEQAPTGSPIPLGVMVLAALTVLPRGAVVTGVTGLQVRGVDVGPMLPCDCAPWCGMSGGARSR